MSCKLIGRNRPSLLGIDFWKCLQELHNLGRKNSLRKTKYRQDRLLKGSGQPYRKHIFMPMFDVPSHTRRSTWDYLVYRPAVWLIAPQIVKTIFLRGLILVKA